MDINDAERLLDAGKLEMRSSRTGEYVRLRRRAVTASYRGRITGVPVFMEAQVEASITPLGCSDPCGFKELRVAP